MMDPETRVTPRGALVLSRPEGRASRAPAAANGRGVLARGGPALPGLQRSDSEPVPLQPRVRERWVADATVQLCTACLTALRTPRLVRQLGLGRWTAVPAGPAAETPRCRPSDADRGWNGTPASRSRHAGVDSL